MPDPRMSDKELAAINAAAVTKEYRVQPHLGAALRLVGCLSPRLTHPTDYRTVSAINGYALMLSCVYRVNPFFFQPSRGSR